VLARLDILPGQTVVESGTGSASLSLGILETLMHKGHLFTFEFNPERAGIARDLI
jgi:tRNA A58 N-methylase Trm61